MVDRASRKLSTQPMTSMTNGHSFHINFVFTLALLLDTLIPSVKSKCTPLKQNHSQFNHLKVGDSRKSPKQSAGHMHPKALNVLDLCIRESFDIHNYLILHTNHF